jgi:hypothetical protein
VHVGVAYYADFPTAPYGSAGDVPFGTRATPTSDGAAVASALSSLPTLSGGDGAESLVEALYTIAGGAPHSPATAPTCAPSGEDAGFCWRADADRAVVVITDAASHEAPDATATPYMPYGATVSHATWTTARSTMSSAGVTLFAIAPTGATGDPVTQLRTMCTDLGLTPDESVVAYGTTGGSADLTTPLRTMLGLVRARYGL